MIASGELSTIVPMPVIDSTWVTGVFTAEGGTVDIPSNFADITAAGTFFGSASVYVVQNGGSLSGGAGSRTVFVEAGGSYTNTGGGSNTVFVQSSGTYTGLNGGSNLVYFEPGANVTNPSATNTSIQEPALQPSFVPEPSTWAFLSFGCLGAVGIIVRRRSRAQFAS